MGSDWCSRDIPFWVVLLYLALCRLPEPVGDSQSAGATRFRVGNARAQVVAWVPRLDRIGTPPPSPRLRTRELRHEANEATKDVSPWLLGADVPGGLDCLGSVGFHCLYVGRPLGTPLC